MSLFDYVKSQLSIIDVISQYVTLKPAGRYMKGPCPFHQETDASFTVSPDKNIFYCFGCQAGGDLIAFIARAESLGQREAVAHLVEQHNITVPAHIAEEAKFKQSSGDARKRYTAACGFIARWAVNALRNSPAAQNYLKKRNMTGEMARYFSIGFFPGGSQAISRMIREASAEGILVKDLVEAHILFEGRSHMRSPFENRILFPIYDLLGRCCGFGGRLFLPNDSRAKYYNSKETDYFHKGKLLFGIDRAKKAMQKEKHAFLVEGYTDVVAMVQHGYSQTVATLGTSCTRDHLKLLSRFIDRLYVIYDGDSAGKKAILRLTDLCWGVNIELSVIALPDKHDPATYLHAHGSLDQLLEHAPDIFTFYVSTLSDQFSKKSLREKLESVEKILKLIAKIDDTIKQDLLLQQASVVMQISLEHLRDRVAEYQGREQKKIKQTKEKRKETSEISHERKETGEQDIEKREAHIIGTLLNSLTSERPLMIDKEAPTYFSPRVREILEQYVAYIVSHTDPENSTAVSYDQFIESLSSEQGKWVLPICMKYSAYISQEELDQLVRVFIHENWKSVVKNIRNAVAQASGSGNTKKTAELMQMFARLKQGIQKKGLI